MVPIDRVYYRDGVLVLRSDVFIPVRERNLTPKVRRRLLQKAERLESYSLTTLSTNAAKNLVLVLSDGWRVMLLVTTSPVHGSVLEQH